MNSRIENGYYYLTPPLIQVLNISLEKESAPSESLGIIILNGIDQFQGEFHLHSLITCDNASEPRCQLKFPV